MVNTGGGGGWFWPKWNLTEKSRRRTQPPHAPSPTTTRSVTPHLMRGLRFSELHNAVQREQKHGSRIKCGMTECVKSRPGGICQSQPPRPQAQKSRPEVLQRLSWAAPRLGEGGGVYNLPCFFCFQTDAR